MLIESKGVRQIPGEPKRRWFSDDSFELIVWFDELDKILSFQLCYDKEHNMRALTWKKPSTYLHHRVDEGEDHPLEPKASPILVADGKFDYKSVAKAFRRESKEINRRISDFVYRKLLAFR